MAAGRVGYKYNDQLGDTRLQISCHDWAGNDILIDGVLQECLIWILHPPNIRGDLDNFEAVHLPLPLSCTASLFWNITLNFILGFKVTRLEMMFDVRNVQFYNSCLNGFLFHLIFDCKKLSLF